MLFWQYKLSVAARSTPAPPALWAAWLMRSLRCPRMLTTTCPSTAMASWPPLLVTLIRLNSNKYTWEWRIISPLLNLFVILTSSGYQHATVKTVELQQRSSSVATQQTTVSSIPSHPSTTGVSNIYLYCTYTPFALHGLTFLLWGVMLQVMLGVVR